MRKAIKLIVILIFIFFITGCEMHNHKLVYIGEKEPTCTEDGIYKHWECRTCGKSFLDKLGEAEILDVTIDKLGHNYDTSNIKWKWSDNYEEAVAVLTCQYYRRHKEKIQAVVTKEENTVKTTYKATIIYNNVEYTDIQPQPSTIGLTYELNPDNISYAVTGIGSVKDTDIVIPSEYNGLPVTSIGDRAFYRCSNLTSITIPNSITSIEYLAFSECTDLISVTLGNRVTSIGYEAFKDCHNLTDIEIPNSITSIGSDAFEDCWQLDHYVDEGCVYFGNDENPFLLLVEAESKKIENAVISKNTKVISPYAFRDCSNLTSIEIPNSVITIGYRAFSYCSNLTSITIGNSITSIGTGAFSYCSSLTSITIPNSVISIGKEVFYNCENLTSIIVDENNPIYDSRDNCNAIIETATNTLILGCQNTTVPDGVTNIGDNAFDKCSDLTNLTLPNSLTSIGVNAFKDCSNLEYNEYDNCYYLGNLENPYIALIKTKDTEIENVVIPNNTKIIYYRAFEDCSNLTSIKLPDSLTSICSYAFYGCSSLTSITLGNNLTSIGDSAFLGCSNLTNIMIPNSVINIGRYAFSGCSGLTSITLGNSLTSIGYEAFYRCSNLTSITIPDSVTSIGSLAFYECTSLTSITLGNSLTSIGDSAFSACSSLTSITIPDSVTSIGYNAFGYCENLTSIIVDKNNPIYDSRENCNALIKTAINTLILGCQNTTVPNGVICIGAGAFSYCRTLTSITIPDSVTSIGDSAFYECTSLTSIIIPNTVTNIGYNAFSGCSSLIIYCEALFKPSGWHSDWNSSNRPVVWRYNYKE